MAESFTNTTEEFLFQHKNIFDKLIKDIALPQLT